MSITATMIPRPGYTVAERFMTLVGNLAALRVGAESSFLVGAASVDVWRPREGHWVFTLIEIVGDDFEQETLRTVAIIPGEFRRLELVDGADNRHQFGQFHSLEAAIGTALDEVTRPVWLTTVVTTAMNEHDEFSC